jgi:hypothetical protein
VRRFRPVIYHTRLTEGDRQAQLFGELQKSSRDAAHENRQSYGVLANGVARSGIAISSCTPVEGPVTKMFLEACIFLPLFVFVRVPGPRGDCSLRRRHQPRFGS